MNKKIQISEELILRLQNSRRSWIEATDKLNDALGTRTTFQYGELKLLFDEVSKHETEYQKIRELVRLDLSNQSG